MVAGWQTAFYATLFPFCYCSVSLHHVWYLMCWKSTCETNGLKSGEWLVHASMLFDDSLAFHFCFMYILTFSQLKQNTNAHSIKQSFNEDETWTFTFHQQTLWEIISSVINFNYFWLFWQYNKNITVSNRPFTIQNIVMTAHFILPVDKTASELTECFVSN